MAVFIKARGNQTYLGTEAEYDQVDYPGSVSDYDITQNADGTISVTHPDLGTDTLTSIEGFWFIGDATWYSVDDAAALSGGGELPPDPTITGTNGDDTMTGTNIDNVFLGSDGNDTINGNGGGYNQVNYDGALEDFIFQQNTDGSVTVFHPLLGTDTLTDIDGFWFSGEAAWYSMADAVRLASGEIPGTQEPTPEPPIVEEPQPPVVEEPQPPVVEEPQPPVVEEPQPPVVEEPQPPIVEEPAPETPTDGGGNGRGNGRGNRPDRNNNEPTNPEEPTTPEEPVINEPVDTGAVLSGGTLVNGIYTGTNGDNALTGSDNAETFYVGMGTDTVDGNGGRDTLRLDGDVEEWTFSENRDGSVSLSHATWGENTITGVEQLTFMRSGTTMTVADAIAATEGLPTFRIDGDGVINGTAGDDVMTGSAGTDMFYGGVGDDSYDGQAGFDQLNYDGNRSEYDISQNADGSYTISHEVWGTDTFTDIEGLYFNGNNEWIAVTDLI